MKKRTLTNTNPRQAKASGVESLGPMDTWKVVQKAWNKKEGWMKSTKALEIPGLGCLVQVTSQSGKQVTEAVCFVPDVRYEPLPTGGGRLQPTSQRENSVITVTSSAVGGTSTSSWKWVGDAGEKLDRLMSQRDQLNKFIQETWKITPTAKQLSALTKVLKGQ